MGQYGAVFLLPAYSSEDSFFMYNLDHANTPAKIWERFPVFPIRTTCWTFSEIPLKHLTSIPEL